MLTVEVVILLLKMPATSGFYYPIHPEVLALPLHGCNWFYAFGRDHFARFTNEVRLGEHPHKDSAGVCPLQTVVTRLREQVGCFFELVERLFILLNALRTRRFQLRPKPIAHRFMHGFGLHRFAKVL